MPHSLSEIITHLHVSKHVLFRSAKAKDPAITIIQTTLSDRKLQSKIALLSNLIYVTLEENGLTC